MIKVPPAIGTRYRVPILLALFAAIALAAIIVVVNVERRGVPVGARLSGTQAASVLVASDERTAIVWSRLKVDASSSMPWPTISAAELAWNARFEGPRPIGCEWILVVLHPHTWQVTGLSDDGFSMGENGPVVTSLIMTAPELREPAPTMENQRRLGGTQFSKRIDGSDAGSLTIAWTVPDGARREVIRSAASVVCDTDVLGFGWLTDTGEVHGR